MSNGLNVGLSKAAHSISLGDERIPAPYIFLSGVVPGAFIADDNAMARFKFYKPEEYKSFVSNLPQKEMPHAKEYLGLIKILASNNARIFAGSLINADSGQGISIL
jgi:hypothetical protein